MAQTIKLKRSATSGATPTTSQLELGEVAINTYDGKMYIKKNVGGTESIVEIGSGGGGSALASSFTLYEYTATANQTTFSGSDSNSNTLAYDTGTPPKILVYLNGVLLDYTTDYTATTGTSVVLTTAAAADDILQVAAYKSSASTNLNISLVDNVKLKFGNDDDLQVFHNGTDSVINQTGTGDLLVQKDETTVAEFNVDGVIVTGDVEADEFIGDVRGAVLFKAQAGETLAKGDVVYISGISGNTTIVSKADADDASKMPAFGLVAAAASANNPVDVYASGILSGIDTSSYSEGDELFVSTTAGALTATAPTGESAALQKIGKVTRSASSGSIFIIGAGRTNAVPNLDDGDIFIGNASNQAVSASLNTKIESYLDGGTSTPTFAGLATTANMTFGDNDKAIFGAGSDLQIFHTGAASVIRDTGTGSLYLDGSNEVFLRGGTSFTNMLKAVDGAQVELYHNNALKLSTSFSGIDVLGSVVSDGLTVDASTAVVQASNAGGTTSFEISNTNGVSTLYNKAALYLSATGAEANAARIESQFTGTVATNHAQELKFYTVNIGSTPVERMKILSGGDVQVGTAAVTGGRYFDIYNTGSTSTDFAITRFITQQVGSSSTTSADIYKRKNGEFGFANNDTNSAAYITFKVGVSDRMRIDSSGNVGIGQSSPSSYYAKNLVVGGGSAEEGITIRGSSSGRSYLMFADGTSGNEQYRGYLSYNHANDALEFATGASERMRITSVGDVLIGKTATDNTTAGIRMNSTGDASFVADGNRSLVLNRKTSDGDLAVFLKDNATVGSAGAYSGYLKLYGGSGSAGSGLWLANGAMYPVGTTNLVTDAVMDIGNSSYRFKDLYLSNGAYLDKVIGHDDPNTYISFIGSDVTQFVQGGAEAMRLDASGNLLVNTSNSSATTGAGIKLTKPTTSGNDDGKLIITGETSTSAQDAFQIYSTGASAYRCFINYAGSIYATSTSITAISDESLKENIRDLDKGLDTVLALQPRRFDWKNGDGNDIMGFVAQEVEEVMPELVHDYKYSETETKLGLKMGDMVPTLVKAIQDQQDIIENLKSRIEQLEGAN